MAITSKEEAEYSHWRPEEVKLIDGNPVRFCDVCVHEIAMGDVEDPDLFVASHIYDWQQSDQGQWIMANAVGQPYWLGNIDYSTFGYRYKIMARLSDKNQTFWKLKWGGRK